MNAILFQFGVCTCIAQNACTDWLRLSAASLSSLPLRCLQRSSRSVSARILAFCARILAASASVIARSQRVNVVPVSGESGSSGAATSRWFRFAGRLFIRQHDWSQFRIHFSAVPKLGAPAEQSTLGKSVRAGDSRDAVPGLFAFQHKGELLFAREAAPNGTSVAC